ncbi:MAG: protein phosphatase 2C domain-containing protein [Mucilaginibacter sp.]|uniref:PP2C family protein-serine/threonine phosphatase n=1 Tax=Mucilaginibacter sp. TaxID=1882438 RepID=UPI003262ECE7
MADQFFGITDTGKQRQNNEDAFIAQQQVNSKFVIACVIDGVGGYSGGEVAAALARESILKRLEKPSGEIIPMLVDCFSLANEKILAEKQSVKQHDSMACVATLAIADMERNQFYYAHVGDTRLYLVRDQSLVKISHDQSFVGFLEDSGRLTEDAAMKHPKRNEINKALGFETQLSKNSDYIETGQSPFLPGDMILLCSDGLTDMINKNKILSIITGSGSIKEKCRGLIDAANEAGGKDNVTVVLVQNNKIPARHNATMPEANVNKPELTTTLTTNENQEVLHTKETPVSQTTGNKTLVIVLSLFTLLFLGTTIWQYLNKTQPAQPIAKPTIIIAKVKNDQEIKLQQSVDQLKGHILVLSDSVFRSPIILTQAIRVNADSIVIKAKGNIVFKSDTSNSGIAFSFLPTCKSIVLDSISFSGFKTAIVACNNVLKLKNVRFFNCGVPVQYGHLITSQKFISVTLLPVSFRADSLPIQSK